MKILEKEFTSKKSKFLQLAREGDVAIYQRDDPSGMILWETIIISRHNGFTLAGNYCPPAENYPSSSAFGHKGFCYNDLERAENKFKELVEKQKNNNMQTENTDTNTDSETVETPNLPLTPRKRGRVAQEVNLVLPEGPFGMTELMVASNNQNKPLVYVALQKLIKNNTVKLVGQKPSANGRGKKANIYRKA